MRITLWGTRGSCPSVGSPEEIREHTEKVSEAALSYIKERIFSESGLIELRHLFRGSTEEIVSQIPVSYPKVFGGETTCIEIETSEGNIIILDCGSGLRRCAQEILYKRKGNVINDIFLFGTHGHLDHRSGIPFAEICFADPPINIHVFGCSGFLASLDSRFGVFSHTTTESTYLDDPVDYTAMTASFQGTELRFDSRNDAPHPDQAWNVQDLSEPIKIGSTTVQGFRSYHGATECLGYRIDHGGKSFVFSTDHEKLSPSCLSKANLGEDELNKSLQAEKVLLSMCRGVDLAYFDGQYLQTEYLGQKSLGRGPALSRVGWGHGCIEDVFDRVRESKIRHALIGHHDPTRSWSSLEEIAQALFDFSGSNEYKVEFARDGQSVEL